MNNNYFCSWKDDVFRSFVLKPIFGNQKNFNRYMDIYRENRLKVYLKILPYKFDLPYEYPDNLQFLDNKFIIT